MGGTGVDLTAILIATIAATPPTLAAVLAYAKTKATGKSTLGQGADIIDGLQRVEAWAHTHESRDEQFEQYVHMRFHDILNQLSVLRSFHHVEGMVADWRGDRQQLRAVTDFRHVDHPSGTDDAPGQEDGE